MAGRVHLAIAALCLAPVLCVSPAFAQEKEVVGYMEKVRIHPEGIAIHAKLDTGADISSINADDISEFEKNKKKWVRFTVRNRFGEQVKLERPIKRYALIKQHGLKAQKRAVIRLGICMAGSYMEEEVNLVNRSKFTTQMLVGRSFLAGTVIVDPSLTYTADPSCQNAPKADKEQKENK